MLVSDERRVTSVNGPLAERSYNWRARARCEIPRTTTAFGGDESVYAIVQNLMQNCATV